MSRIEPKKLALIRILQIFQKYSDFDHRLTYEDIARHLNDEYGIVLERKAIGRDIGLLREAGFVIESKHSGNWLNEREFTEDELFLLADAALASRRLTAGGASKLIAKLGTLASKYFRPRTDHIFSVGEYDRADILNLFCNIECADKAIEWGRQLRFDYNRHGTDKRLHRIKSYPVSPYQLILHEQKYYLLARDELWARLAYYRLDLITNMSISDKPLVPITSIEGYENGINYNELASVAPYFCGDSPKWVEMVVDTDFIDTVMDRFGNNFRISKIDGGEKCKITVRAGLKAMEHWALRNAGKVRVVSPPQLVEQIRADLRSALAEYEEDKPGDEPR